MIGPSPSSAIEEDEEGGERGTKAYPYYYLLL